MEAYKKEIIELDNWHLESLLAPAATDEIYFSESVQCSPRTDQERSNRTWEWFMPTLCIVAFKDAIK